MRYHHATVDETVNVTKRHPLREFFGYIASILLLIAAIYGSVRYTVEWIIPHVDPQMEQQLWQSALQDRFIEPSETRSASESVTEARLQALLDRIPKKGLPQQGYKLIYIDEPDTINAMALPSGKIILYSGLVNQLRSENGIAFVLGHELGHFANRDHLRGMGTMLLTSILLAPIIGSDTGISSLLGGMKTSLDMNFSRAQEREADQYGLMALTALYGHAGGATEFFELMAKEEEMERWLSYLSTHPASDARAMALTQQITRERIPVKDVQPFTVQK